MKQVRWSLAFTGSGLVDHFNSGTTNLTTSWEELVGPIAEVADRIVQLWELDPVFDALAADLPEGHPGAFDPRLSGGLCPVPEGQPDTFLEVGY